MHPSLMVICDRFETNSCLGMVMDGMNWTWRTRPKNYHSHCHSLDKVIQQISAYFGYYSLDLHRELMSS